MTLLTVLMVLTLIASVAVLGVGVLLVRQSRAPQASTQLALLSERIDATVEFQGNRISDLQRTVDVQLRGLSAQSREEAAHRLQADTLGRTELQTNISERLLQMESRLSNLDKAVNVGLDRLRTTNVLELEKIRAEVSEKLQTSLADSLRENSQRISELKSSVAVELEKVRKHNDEQLEKMRATVDEKLQGTLEKRLGESFKLVSERLELVQRGLGEMQSLATDVGGLKRVLSGVKSRGTWGEVLLSRQLEDVMTPGQYEENVAIRRDSGERVEFAVRLPGRENDNEVFLPIDSKFPQDPYERLLTAQESGDLGVVASCSKELERAIRLQAQTISDKYIHPPLSTDFAIMYLPTEGLFAEAVRVPGLAAELQRKHRVMLTGPTTLMALLNSLQMGFKTLAIEQRSSEVWRVLAAAKEEFVKYGRVWEKLGKQLKTAQNTVEEAGRRTRAVEKRLRDVETLESSGISVSGTDDASPIAETDSIAYGSPRPMIGPEDSARGTERGLGNLLQLE